MTTAQSNAISYTVCDDATTVANAVEVLQPCRYIAFDCEGRKLGREGGCLSIISLCAIPSTGTQKAHIFLIDVMALDTETVRPIFDLLSSQEHVKIMFDGRMDWSELYHRSDVQLTQVLDLQLADIDSRSKRGERLHEQLCRISSFFYGGLNQDSYNMVHRLNGLEFCAKEHNIVNRFGSVKPRYFSHDGWDKRPLGDGYLQYAAMDVVLIVKLYRDFVDKGYINESRLLEQSERYILLSKRSIPGPGHSLLPLEILSKPDMQGNRSTCDTCSRSLSEACFPRVGYRSNKMRNCWVCHTVGVL